mmetsp:Transcript_52562/g.159775  ORF Transcript_52562/g.159775 Transcript_52562/m.159775 type:complete len:510 (-) Transcript_52562:121-1650(-)
MMAVQNLTRRIRRSNVQKAHWLRTAVLIGFALLCFTCARVCVCACACAFSFRAANEVAKETVALPKTAVAPPKSEACEDAKFKFPYPGVFPFCRLPNELLQRALPRRVPDPGMALLSKKLLRGDLVRVLALGGSVTVGHDCTTPWGAVGNDCAWPTHLEAWFRQRYPRSNVRVTNAAVAATSPKVVVHSLGSLASTIKPDLVILDFLVNELDDDYQTALHYEKLIVIVWQLFPDSAVLSVEGACTAKMARGRLACRRHLVGHLHIVDYHQIPTINYVDVVDYGLGRRLNWSCSFKPAFSCRRPNLWAPNHHPAWHTHVYMAVAIAYGMTQYLSRAATYNGSTLVPLHLRPTFNSRSALDSLSVCIQPQKTYDARFAPRQRNWTWRLFEDRPGKPGWISTLRGARICFDLDFGAHPFMGISYLRSYEGMGQANISMNGCTIPIAGLWGKHASVADTLVLNAARRWVYDDKMFEGDARRRCGFHVAQNSTKELCITHGGGGKFKILQVFSC